MRSRPNPLYRLLHSDYNESFDYYRPQLADFHDFVSLRLPSGWQVRRRGIWFHCSSPHSVVPLQGWKIHVSATPANARQILDNVVSILVRHGNVDFKFALDLSTLFLLNSKNWSRGGSGKFLTIYPKDLQTFLHLIEELHVATRAMSGPYILSDHRYKDSRVVYYRYGGMRIRDSLNIKGERCPMLVSPDGREVQDRRLAYPVVPAWVTAPFTPDEPEQEDDSGHSLKHGRYRVQDALAFSNAGGIYRAIDTLTGKNVIIKEARPHVNATADGYDAVELLKKEYRLLTVVADTHIAPEPIDLFQQWEHWFLVEEYLEGAPMGSYSAAHNVLLRTRSKPSDYQAWYATFRSSFMRLIKILETLHSRNIVFADLSTSNVIVCHPGLELKLIDFEGAFQADVDRPTMLYTPGFASPERLAGRRPVFADDFYSLGAALLAFLFPLNGLFHLRPEAKTDILAAIRQDTGLPEPVANLILDLMKSQMERPAAAEMLRVLDQSPACDAVDAHPGQAIDYRALVEGIVTHITNKTEYSREDRLFPADAKVFVTNPLSLAYGASGVAYALDKAAGKCPTRVLDWILSRKISPDAYPPGLYVGSSGIAWALLELGAIPEAEKILQGSFRHPLLYESADVFHGAAGWGMASLRFFAETGNELYLDKAIAAGTRLLQTAIDDGRGYSWPAAEGAQHIGFAHGSSGIALFLLYLHLVTGNCEFAETAELAFGFDLSFAAETKDGGLSWPSSAASPSPIYPYWRFGSAGIGSVALRFYSFLGGDHYKQILDKIHVDTDRKYAVLPGKFSGLAGIGDFLLDLYDFSGEPKYLKSAQRAAEGLALYRVDREGIAFPGDNLSRLSCDYGTGSAGVALFLSRLEGRRGADFMLDSLAAAHRFKRRVEAPKACV
jgi:Lanthionine synthetase C-like protein/Protein kinase domain